MKKINSIGYAHKIIGLALLFLVVIPMCCYIFSFIFQVAPYMTFIHISVGIGLFILAFFIGLLFIELHQDKRNDRQYPEIKKKKLRLEDGRYECQSCGSRQVTVDDKSCRTCGMKFNTERGS